MRLILLLAAALAFPAVPASPSAAASAATADEPPADAAAWRRDLAFLRERLQAMHPDPFGRAGRGNFDRAAAQFEASLPGLTRDQAMVGLMRLVAMLRDGHTTVPPFAQPGFHILPLRFYLYGTDLYLSGADRAYAGGLGGRLVSIGGIGAAEL